MIVTDDRHEYYFEVCHQIDLVQASQHGDSHYYQETLVGQGLLVGQGGGGGFCQGLLAVRGLGALDLWLLLLLLQVFLVIVPTPNQQQATQKSEPPSNPKPHNNSLPNIASDLFPKKANLILIMLVHSILILRINHMHKEKIPHNTPQSECNYQEGSGTVLGRGELGPDAVEDGDGD